MPENGIVLKNADSILSFEEIEKIVIEAVKLGFDKFRITGGEPLVRKDIEILLKKISRISGVKKLGLTTNGQLLKEKAVLLKSSGLESINISLDTLNSERYRRITRIGGIDPVLEGIKEAKEEGFSIKINMVVMDDTTPLEISDMKDFCKINSFELQLIQIYDIGKQKTHKTQLDRPPNCQSCNRIRLLSDGNLKPCLHSNLEIPVDMNHITKSIEKAILLKPKAGQSCTGRTISEIGG
jgi:cyclic pyranopterin phosphate synthase